MLFVFVHVAIGRMPSTLVAMTLKLPILNQKWYLDVLDNQYREALGKDKRWTKGNKRFVLKVKTHGGKVFVQQFVYFEPKGHQTIDLCT